MHDNKRGAQSRRYDANKLLVGNIQDTTDNSLRVFFCNKFEGWLLVPNYPSMSVRGSEYCGNPKRTRVRSLSSITLGHRLIIAHPDSC